jgi:hypothetical protein
MGILGDRAVRRGSNDAKTEEAGNKGSADVLEDRRKKPRTAAEEEAVRNFRRLLAQMLGEPPPDEGDLNPRVHATRDEEFIPGNTTFATDHGDVAQVDGPAADASQHAEDTASLSSETAFREDITGVPGEDKINQTAVSETDTASLSSETAFREDITGVPGEDKINQTSVIETDTASLSSETAFREDITGVSGEDKINPTSVIETDAVSQETVVGQPEKQTTPGSVDPEWVRIELKDGRRLEAWKRSAPSNGQQLLILDVITTFDSEGKEISGSPADSFVYRTEVIAINGSKIDQVERTATRVNPSHNDETPTEKERY